MTTTYFANLHNEAMALLIESRNYIQNLRSVQKPSADVGSGTSAVYLDLSLETMRLTSRLTQIMAWMLAQRAVSAGEITAQEGASERFRLSGQSVCLEHDMSQDRNIPPKLQDLLQRSYDLYLRVSRLEAQINGRLADERERPALNKREGDGAATLQLLPTTTSDQGPQNAY